MTRRPPPPGQAREPRITASPQRRKLLAFLVANAPAQAPRPVTPTSTKRRKLLAFLVANGLGQAACAPLLGLGVRQAFDRLVRHGGTADAKLYALIGAGFIVAAAGSGWLRSRERFD